MKAKLDQSRREIAAGQIHDVVAAAACSRKLLGCQAQKNRVHDCEIFRNMDVAIGQERQSAVNSL